MYKKTCIAQTCVVQGSAVFPFNPSSADLKFSKKEKKERNTSINNGKLPLTKWHLLSNEHLLLKLQKAEILYFSYGI